MARIISVIPFLLVCALGRAPRGRRGRAHEGRAVSRPLRKPRTALTGLAEPPAPTEPTADIKLQDNPPARYTVKRGDTLWGISEPIPEEPLEMARRMGHEPR